MKTGMPHFAVAFPSFFFVWMGELLHGVDVEAAVDNGYCTGDK